jgi:hypothetical protein
MTLDYPEMEALVKVSKRGGSYTVEAVKRNRLAMAARRRQR